MGKDEGGGGVRTEKKNQYWNIAERFRDRKKKEKESFSLSKETTKSHENGV
jgi:hypothetical protein